MSSHTAPSQTPGDSTRLPSQPPVHAPGGESTRLSDDGATVVITHRVRLDCHADYERWTEEIAPLSRQSPGFIDWHIVRPVAGVTETYTVIIRFDTADHLRAWMQSPQRRELIDRVSPLFVGDDDYYISSGLDFWFTEPGTKPKVPVRWKQFLVTWSAILPLVIIVSQVVVPVFRALGLPFEPPLVTVAITAIVVGLMVYVVMPRYTKLVQHWLFT